MSTTIAAATKAGFMLISSVSYKDDGRTAKPTP
jgi:hypothetical protein